MTARHEQPRLRYWLRAAAVALTCAVFLYPSGSRAAPARVEGFDVKALGKIDVTLENFIRDKKIPGASMLIARDGQIVYEKAFGMRDVENAKPMTKETLLRIYSMTKPVAAAAVMMLVDDGKLKLSDDVSKYVPEFAHMRVYVSGKGDDIKTEPAKPMTIADLLSHTSGLSYSFLPDSPVAPLYAKAGLVGGQWYHNPEVQGLPDVAKRLATIPLLFQPGTKWHYGMSLEIASLIVERVSGEPFQDFLQKRLFSPLKMHDTGFEVPKGEEKRFAALYTLSPKSGLTLIESPDKSPFLRKPSVYSGSGGLVSTLGDYYRFAQMLQNGGTLDSVRVLSEASVKAMMTNHLRPDQLGELTQVAAFGFGGTGKGLGFGYGGAVITDAKAAGGIGGTGEYSWGGAASTTFWADPQNHVTVVFMTQLLPSGAVPLRDTLHKLVYQALDTSRP